MTSTRLNLCHQLQIHYLNRDTDTTFTKEELKNPRYELNLVSEYKIGHTLSLLILFHSIDKNYYEQIRTLIGIPVVCIVLSLLNRENAIYGWVFKPLKWLGSYSLEIYLLHLQIWRGLAFVTTWDSTIRIIIAIPLTLLLCQPVHNGINSILKSKYYCIK